MAPDSGTSAQGESRPYMKSMLDEFCALASETSTTPRADADDIEPTCGDSDPKCAVCQNLAHRFSIARIHSIGGYPAAIRKAAVQVIDMSQGAPETRDMPEGGTGVYFANANWTPSHPRASEWIRSAIAGCPTCQLVVGAVSAILPGWFVGYDADDAELGLGHKRIFALAVDDLPLVICLTDMTHRWLHLRHDYFQVFTEEGQPRCWPTIASAEPVCSTNHEPAAIKKAKRWIRSCYARHQCGPQNPGFLPTRLISLEGDGPLPRCRLVDSGEIDSGSADRRPPYVALSYCWGPSPNLRTVLDNLPLHQEEIPLRDAPDAVRDAVRLTRDLGYQYIWIDALCIVQDDDGDWAAESSTLGRVYKMADLVLSNDTSADCRQPIFTTQVFGSSASQTTFIPHHLQSPRSSSTYVPEFLRDPPAAAGPNQAAMPRVYVRRSPYEAHSILPQDKLSPLNSRAWTLQESLMARRRLILTPLEMIWQCLGEYRCECVHDQSLMLGPAGGRAQLLMFGAMRSMVFPAESASARPESARLYWLWKIMVMQYSARNVTDWRDRLVAIGGLAQAMQTALEGEPGSRPLEDGSIRREEKYHAGLWRGDIVGGLLWAARPASELIDGDAYAYSSLQKARARVGHPAGGREGNPFKEFVALQHQRSVSQAFRRARAKLPLVSGKPFQTLPIDRRFRRLNGPGVRAFPSWSWTSTPYPVEWFLNTQDITAEFPFRSDVDITEVRSDLAASDPKQRITSGHIILKGRLMAIRLRSHAALWMKQEPPDFAAWKIPDPQAQGIWEFFEAVHRSKAYALFPGDLVTGFSPDSACLYGDVRQTYEGWGPLMATEYLEYRERSSVVVVVLRLMAIAISRRLAGFASLVWSLFFRRQTKAKAPALDMAPCWPSAESGQRAWRLCQDRRCNCHRGWTDPKMDPFYALRMGSYKVEDLRGRSLQRLVFLVLRPSPFTKDAFVRIGIGTVERYGDEAGYYDFFKYALPTTIQIE